MTGGLLVTLDGVLVDTSELRHAALDAAAAADGLRVSPLLEMSDPDTSFEELVRAALDSGSAGSTLVQRGVPQLDDTAVSLIAHRAEREYRDRVAAGVTLVDGAARAIVALADRWRVGIVTAWRRADAERVLALADLEATVRFVVAADDGPGLASARARFARGLARLRRAIGAGPAVALVAGPRDFAAANAAGARAVLVGTDTSLAELTPARLAAVLDTLAPPR